MTVPSHCNYHQDGRPWSRLKVKDLVDPPQNWMISEGCHPEQVFGQSPNGTEMAARPQLSYPPDILTLDPLWVGCHADAYNWAFDDPPHALVPANGFGLTDVPVIRETTVTQQGALDPTPGHVPVAVSASKTAINEPAQIAGFPAKTTSRSNSIPIFGPSLESHNSGDSDPHRLFDPPPSIMHGRSLKATSDGAIMFGNDMVARGQESTIDGDYISVGLDRMILDTKTYAMPTFTNNENGIEQRPTSLLSSDGQSENLGKSDAIIDGSLAISPEQQSVIDPSAESNINVVDTVVYTLPFSLRPTAQILASAESSINVVDTVVYTLPFSLRPTAQISASADEIPYSSNQNSISGLNAAYFMEASAITPGGEMTIQGTYVSAGSSQIIIGSHTYDIPARTKITNEVMIPAANPTISGSEPMIAMWPAAGTTTVTGGSAHISSSGQTASAAEQSKPNLSNEVGIGALVISMLGYKPPPPPPPPLLPSQTAVATMAVNSTAQSSSPSSEDHHVSNLATMGRRTDLSSQISTILIFMIFLISS